MKSEKFPELEERSAADMLQRAKLMDAMKRIEAHSIVSDVIAAMKEEGKAMELSDEEELLLQSFRRFKSIIKAKAIFKWQTTPIEGDGLLAVAGELIHITAPQDVSSQK